MTNETVLANNKKLILQNLGEPEDADITIEENHYHIDSTRQEWDYHCQDWNTYGSIIDIPLCINLLDKHQVELALKLNNKIHKLYNSKNDVELNIKHVNETLQILNNQFKDTLEKMYKILSTSHLSDVKKMQELQMKILREDIDAWIKKKLLEIENIEHSIYLDKEKYKLISENKCFETMVE